MMIMKVVKKVPLSEPGNRSSERCGLCDVNLCACCTVYYQHPYLSSLYSFPPFLLFLFLFCSGSLETLPSNGENNLATGIVHKRPKTRVNESAALQFSFWFRSELWYERLFIWMLEMENKVSFDIYIGILNAKHEKKNQNLGCCGDVFQFQPPEEDH